MVSSINCENDEIESGLSLWTKTGTEASLLIDYVPCGKIRPIMILVPHPRAQFSLGILIGTIISKVILRLCDFSFPSYGMQGAYYMIE